MNIFTDARRTLIMVPTDLITGDGVYTSLPTDLHAAGLLMNHAQASNAHALSVLRAPERQWAEALRRWLTDPTPESLTASVAPRN